MAANIKDRAYTFSFSFGPEQVEKVEGGFVVHGASLNMPKRQYRHTNPTRKPKLNHRPRSLKEWRSEREWY